MFELLGFLSVTPNIPKLRSDEQGFDFRRADTEIRMLSNESSANSSDESHRLQTASFVSDLKQPSMSPVLYSLAQCC
jgi:hypothetical protein